MNLIEAKELLSCHFSSDIRIAFKRAIESGFELFAKIKDNKDYRCLGEYQRNGDRRLLYSSICCNLDNDIIKKAGFQTELEQYTSSFKTHIYNDKLVIDVFDSEHNHNTHYQESRFNLNRSDKAGKKYIIIEYYNDEGILERIMLRIYDEKINLIIEEEL